MRIMMMLLLMMMMTVMLMTLAVLLNFRYDGAGAWSASAVTLPSKKSHFCALVATKVRRFRGCGGWGAGCVQAQSDLINWGKSRLIT